MNNSDLVRIVFGKAYACLDFIFLIFISLTFSVCVMDKGAISIKNGGVRISGAKTQMDSASVTSVSIVNNQLIIAG